MNVALKSNLFFRIIKLGSRLAVLEHFLKKTVFILNNRKENELFSICSLKTNKEAFYSSEREITLPLDRLCGLKFLFYVRLK